MKSLSPSLLSVTVSVPSLLSVVALRGPALLQHPGELRPVPLHTLGVPGAVSELMLAEVMLLLV